MRATPASEIIREGLHARRGMLRVQLSRHFEAELTHVRRRRPTPILAAADALTQIETIDWFVVDGGYTVEQTRDALVTGLHRLLGPAAQPAEPTPSHAASDLDGAPMTAPDSFDGVIGNTIAESQPSWPVRPHPGDRRAERGRDPARRHRLRPSRLLRLDDQHAEHRPARR